MFNLKNVDGRCTSFEQEPVQITYGTKMQPFWPPHESSMKLLQKSHLVQKETPFVCAVSSRSCRLPRIAQIRKKYSFKVILSDCIPGLEIPQYSGT